MYSVILTSHFPHRWHDLASLKLLILRTYRQFSGSAWCEYDKAFRQHAAASKLSDWSGINVQLFNFHTAGAGLRSYVASNVSRTATGSSFEPLGNNNRDCSVVCLCGTKVIVLLGLWFVDLSTLLRNVSHRIARSNAKHCLRLSPSFLMQAPKSVVSNLTLFIQQALGPVFFLDLSYAVLIHLHLFAICISCLFTPIVRHCNHVFA